LVTIFSGMLDFLFTGAALVADADDGEEEDSSTSAETIENFIIEGFDVVVRFLVVLCLWGSKHIGNLNFLILRNSVNVIVFNLSSQIVLLWLEVGFKPVLKSKVSFLIFIGIGYDHDAFLDTME